ncbi:hypothetical protein MMC14_004004 [Varicellaria rhodocarpa]|nr:hypothetical protein [Varicellaria rhodocarpa]
MVKIHKTNQTYAYPLPAVSLAYFLRYPNPYSTHVLSTDVISRSFDPLTQRLHTTRLHLKRSKLPPAILKILPKGILGAGVGGEGKSFVLEKSTVDVKEGWMETESQNLEWTGVLSVIERAKYTRTGTEMSSDVKNAALEMGKDVRTDVTTTVTFRSRFGQALRGNRWKGDKGESNVGEAEEEKKCFFSSWSTSSLQRTIEGMGVRRARDSLVKSSHGMNVVLERWRNGGLGGMLEGMRRDRELVISAGKET